MYLSVSTEEPSYFTKIERIGLMRVNIVIWDQDLSMM